MNKILITGGSQGIGLAIAKKFHAEGWHVTIVSRKIEKIDQLKGEMDGLQGYVADFSQKNEVKKMAESYLNDHGAPDILVNNAGAFQPGDFVNESEDLFEYQMDLNLRSAYYVTKGIIPALVEQQAGLIVNMCSVASIKAYPGGSAYAISKHALLGLSRVMREDLKQHGIRVTAILAGATWTPSWDGAGFPEERMMPAEDIAETVWNTWNMSARTVPEEILIRPFEGDI